MSQESPARFLGLGFLNYHLIKSSCIALGFIVEGPVVESCAILTTTANTVVTPIHDRMPVILHPDEFGLWLDRQVHDVEMLTKLFSPYPAGKLAVYQVSTLLNNVAHDGPECIVPEDFKKD